jgi:hypothetical protein
MRIGQLQGALLSVVGLREIEPSIAALQNLPLLFRSWDEVDHVREKMRPAMEQRFLDKRLRRARPGATPAGCASSRRSRRAPDDYKGMKFFAWGSEPEQQAIMKSLGYTPVPLETADILPAIQTGMINVLPSTPYFALASQVYGTARHMLEINWAPIVGALVVTQKAWDAMSPAGQQAAARGRRQGRRADARAGAQGGGRGGGRDGQARPQVVHRPNAEQMREWNALAEKLYPRIRGSMVPAETFDEVFTHLKAYRAGKAPSELADATALTCATPARSAWRALARGTGLAGTALALMMLIPLVEMADAPAAGPGVDNAPVLVQHLGLVLAMFGALAAERHGHLTTLGSSAGLAGGGTPAGVPLAQAWRKAAPRSSAACWRWPAGASWPARWTAASRWPTACRCGGCRLHAAGLCAAGLPSWARAVRGDGWGWRWLRPGCCPVAGWLLAAFPGGTSCLLGRVLLAAAGAAGRRADLCGAGRPGAGAVLERGLPLASVALSHYQITVNPSLPALPLFTLAGLVFAAPARRSAGRAVHRAVRRRRARHGAGRGAAVLGLHRLHRRQRRHHPGPGRPAAAAAAPCRLPEQRGIGLVTSASAWACCWRRRCR